RPLSRAARPARGRPLDDARGEPALLRPPQGAQGAGDAGELRPPGDRGAGLEPFGGSGRGLLETTPPGATAESLAADRAGRTAFPGIVPGEPARPAEQRRSAVAAPGRPAARARIKMPRRRPQPDPFDADTARRMRAIGPYQVTSGPGYCEI